MSRGKLEHWRKVLEKTGLQISEAKTEFLELRFKNDEGENGSVRNVKLGGQLVNKVEIFRYLGSVIHDNRGIMEDIS